MKAQCFHSQGLAIIQAGRVKASYDATVLIKTSLPTHRATHSLIKQYTLFRNTLEKKIISWKNAREMWNDLKNYYEKKMSLTNWVARI